MKRNIIYTALTFIFLVSCGKEASTKESEGEIKTEKIEEHDDETPQSIASLTDEQIKSVGVTLGKIEMKELTSTIKANGALRVPNNNKATITSMYGGIIKTLNVQIGDFVRKGQVIASISNPEYIQLQEQYLTVKSKIAFAEQEYRRQKELFDNDAGAKKNLQSSDAELKTLRTQRSSLQRQLQIMGINPATVNNGNLRSGLVITSPISGTVSNISAQIGSYVDISSPVADVIDNGSLHLDLQVFEKDLPKMKVGQIVHFKLTNNPEIEYDAKIYSIGSSFENESKTISVHCSVTGNKTGLIDGMNITGIVSLDKSTTPAVPNEAIVEADSKYYIFIKTNKKPEEHTEEKGEHADEKQAHGKASNTVNFEKIEIVKGSSDMGYTAITTVNEIPADASVVTKGAFFVNAKLSNSGEHGH
ncbi:efflux RND transporter periplasmic adaptor subunit [Chryseobacterium balustinum]|uniref:Cation efflux system protein CzcB n=1 Tax=Chryseobacterium balustinum TaxID=246 RepID=A0AAX2ILB8_9FLAO|nr:efflux RND transporter periplasmic adaptor subunit [Chryseobacterium balustinum]AZB29633.1 efflux RND transporter periplasmic adaptor subunit [Chryseobacterium balustinum]SKB88340.1 RND family efflux transporter, MFP subunit [Chryseobacterium balustinum]SQA89980.1 Cation efflux system protein CzcB [Chryseobacterium balustinum]